MIVVGHKKRVDDIFQKGRELLEASSSLRREKIELKEKHLGWLLELQKVLEEVSYLQEKMDSAQKEILSLREQINRASPEKLTLECELRAIQSSLESHDMDVEELRTEVSQQLNLYDNLWLAHRMLLEEAQKLCSEVITLRSGIRVEDVGARLGVRNRSP